MSASTRRCSNPRSRNPKSGKWRAENRSTRSGKWRARGCGGVRGGGAATKMKGEWGRFSRRSNGGGFLSAERQRSASDGGSSRGKEQWKLNRGSGGGLLERAACGPGGAGEAASGACCQSVWPGCILYIEYTHV